MRVRGRREQYAAIRRQRPELFTNPPGAAHEILFDPREIKAAETAETARLNSRGLPSSWSRTGIVYQDPYQIVVRDAVRHPDGSLGTYVRTMPTNSNIGVAILPILDGEVVLLRHFRHATRGNHLEIPRGFGEPGIAPAEQAQKELREEIGSSADKLIDLGGFHSNTGIATDYTALYLAEIHELGEPQTSEGISDIMTYPARDVARMIRLGKITDSFTIGAFTRALLAGLLPGLALA